MSNIYTCGTYMCVLQDYSQASYTCVHICVYKYVLHICVYKYVHCIIDIYIYRILCIRKKLQKSVPECGLAIRSWLG